MFMAVAPFQFGFQPCHPLLERIDGQRAPANDASANDQGDSVGRLYRIHTISSPD